MAIVRREVVKVGGDLAVEFANTVHAPGDPAGSLHSWSDLVDFLELRGGVSPADGTALRAMGATDARRCASTFAEAIRLRETIRAMLDAMARKGSLRAGWVAEVNQALASGAGASRLVRQDSGWRLGLAPGPAGPLRVLAPIAGAVADLAASGRSVEIHKCANPRCLLYFRDRSRTRRRRWCSMAVCGNRMKVAAHARRHGRHRPA
ncbi:MAG TPA: ABATE domain-containing protein [Methylomirabilota bacterium]|nr:ABATE domain-containing protein [Methylomirabilota bacterium]